MLISDFLHEYEISDFKTWLTHLVRMLVSLKDDKVAELDARSVHCISIEFDTG